MDHRRGDNQSHDALEELRKTMARYEQGAVEQVIPMLNAVLHRQAVSPGRSLHLVADWQTSREGRREVRLLIRKVLHDNGLPPVGNLFDALYRVASERHAIPESAQGPK